MLSSEVWKKPKDLERFSRVPANKCQFSVCSEMLFLFYRTVVASIPFFPAMCWGMQYDE